MSKTERMHAEQVSAAVDELVRDPGTQPGLLAVEAEDAELLATARQLARLPALLGPADPAWAQQVLRRVRIGTQRGQRRFRLRPGWAIATAAAMLLLATLLTPVGQTAVASFMAVFRLGRTEVRITPVDTPPALATVAAAQATAIRQPLTLEEAQAQVPFTIPQPTYLPPGHRLQGVIGHTYPDLPAWIPQPFFVDLLYGDGRGGELALRVYPITLGEGASISRMSLEAAPIQDVQDVDINGQPGVLLRLGIDRSQTAWQELVWEQGDLVLALSAGDLAEAELLRIARSVH